MPRHVDPGHPCPCTSGLAFGACCRPYVRGETEAPDAVALMRSRFTAFAIEEARHLLRTVHAAHPDRARPEADVLRDLRRASRQLEYQSLAILDHATDSASGRAQVVFLAGVFDRGRDRSFVERSDFVREGGGWRYVSGALVDAAQPGARELDLATFDGALAQPR